MKRKIYKLLSSAKQGLLALALMVFSVTAYSQTTYTLNYTGSIQTLTLQAGNYSAECWGAIGGWHNSDVNLYRGKAGYSTGTFSLTTTTTVYIAVGGAGGVQTSNSVPGGWNGGGNGKYYSYSFNGGGGASHVATVTGVLSTLSSNTAAILIVAAGGAGGCTGITPGNGGGMIGGNSTRSGCTGGTQTSPGGTSITGGGNAVFGLGWDASTSGGSYGGGGGGWYGGGTESGGSSYIGGVTSGTTIMFGQTGYVTNPVTTGDGLVMITELCSISLTAAGSSNSVAPVICSGTSLTLTTNAVSNYSWSTGVTGTNQIVLTPTASTLITVYGTSSLNCTTARSMSITVSSGLPVLSLSVVPSNSICLGDSVSITASGALTYTYSGGITPGVKFAPTQNTTYTITGKNGCGTSSVTTTITVSPLVIFATASSPTVCAGNISTLTAVGAQNYTWYPQVSFNNPYNASPSANTIYTVVGKTGGCFGQTTVQVSTKPNPTLTMVGTATSICEGQSATITVSGASTYTWQNTSLSGSVVVVNPNTPVAYNVQGIGSNGCTSGAQYILLAWPAPTVTGASTPTQICVGASANLQLQGADGYTWAHGPSGGSLTVSPVTTTNYVAVGTETVHGCSASATVAVEVFQATISISPNTAVCPGGTVVLSSGAATSYTWGHGGSAQQTTVSPASTTIYTINATGQVNSMTCLRTNTVEVVVHPAAVITATAHRTTICKNETTTLTASGGASYLWNTGATSTVVVIKGLSAGTLNYTVTGTDNNTCRDSHTVSVAVSNCVGIAETHNGLALKVYPNPNSGVFTIESAAGSEFLITNVLGEVVKNLSAELNPNGVIVISDLPKGVYVISSKNDIAQSTRVIVE